MPTRTLLLTSLLPLAVACGAGLSADTGAGADGMSSADQAVADELWADIAGYENWNQHEDWVGVHLSEDGTHGTTCRSGSMARPRTAWRRAATAWRTAPSSSRRATARTTAATSTPSR